MYSFMNVYEPRNVNKHGIVCAVLPPSCSCSTSKQKGVNSTLQAFRYSIFSIEYWAQSLVMLIWNPSLARLIDISDEWKTAIIAIVVGSEYSDRTKVVVGRRQRNYEGRWEQIRPIILG